jgi:hypothetical protein
MTTRELTQHAGQHLIAPLANTTARWVAPAVTWVRQELDLARREAMDDQYLATTRDGGSTYDA